MPDDISRLINSISKDLGNAASIMQISAAPNPYVIRRPLGVMSIDRDLKGGLPGGTMVQIFGPEGAGKDYLSNLAMAENQKKYGDKSNIFWQSFGYKPDLPFMRLCGVQIAKTDEELLEEGVNPEEATEAQRGKTVGNILFIDVAKKGMEHPAESLLSVAVELIRSNKFQIGVINELGSGETKDNVKKKLNEEARMATFASLMADFCRKFYSAMRIPGDDGRPNETTVVMINPVRANLNAFSFDKYTQGSGHALKHAKAIDLHLDKMGFIKESRKGKQVKVGKKIKWRIAKGKHGISEGAEGEYHFYFAGMKDFFGIDTLVDLVNVAKAEGVVFNKGRYWYILDYEDKIEGGIDGVVSLVRERPELLEEIRTAVLEKANG